MFKAGDKVKITNPHDEGHSTGVIAFVSSETPYAVNLDGMAMENPHKWYVDSEMLPTDVTADKREEFPINLSGEILKADLEKQQVFGWASVSSVNGKPVIDKQGDMIDDDEMERMAYDFMLNSRVGGEMHQRKNVGRTIESVVFTKEKQQAMGIDLGKVGWWIGFKIDDPEVWAAVKSGKYKMFSIGGRGKRRCLKCNAVKLENGECPNCDMVQNE